MKDRILAIYNACDKFKEFHAVEIKIMTFLWLQEYKVHVNDIGERKDVLKKHVNELNKKGLVAKRLNTLWLTKNGNKLINEL